MVVTATGATGNLRYGKSTIINPVKNVHLVLFLSLGLFHGPPSPRGGSMGKLDHRYINRNFRTVNDNLPTRTS